MSECSLINELTEVGMPVHAAKNEHITKLPVLRLLCAASQNTSI